MTNLEIKEKIKQINKILATIPLVDIDYDVNNLLDELASLLHRIEMKLDK